jgi:two-component system alkaline phosphatase synthesis response regulator PhoP
MAKILIIEDEVELVKVLRSYLEQSGYQVIEAQRGDKGLTLWQQQQPDLVILDLNLPGMDGLDVARHIRQKGDTPILMLTARVEEIDQIVGLEVGADDYVTKPFSPKVVVARVRALLRRASAGRTPEPMIRVADLEIDVNAHTVRRGDQEIDLTPTEFNLLVAMASQPGRVFSRYQLLEAVQGVAYEGYERTIDAHIKNLRAKLEKEPKHPQYIETVFGVGYRFARTIV